MRMAASRVVPRAFRALAWHLAAFQWMVCLGGRRNPRGSRSAPFPTSAGSRPSTRPDTPGDRADGDGSSDWITLTALAAAAIFVCYADRSNISTAIIPMAGASR